MDKIYENLPRWFHSDVSPDVESSLSLLQCGWERCLPNHSFANLRNIYLIHYVRSGRGILNINGNHHILDTGSIFLIRPNQPAIYSADRNDPWEYYYFAFNGTLSSEVLEKTVFREGNFHAKIEDNGLAEAIVEAALRLHEGEHDTFEMLECLFHFLRFIAASDEAPTVMGKPGDTSAYYAQQVLHYIHANYSKHITVSDIADTLHINRSQLYSHFRKQMGTGIEQYLTEVRLQEACRLLCGSNAEINMIASMVGYNSYSAFTRMFTRLQGISPTEYRRQNQNTVFSPKESFPPLDFFKKEV